MAKGRTISVSIVGDADSLTRSFGQASKATDKFGKSSDASSSKMGRLKTATKGAAVGGVGVLITGLKGSVSAAMDAEKSQTAMEAQLKASNISYKDNAGTIDSVIQKHSKLAAVDDEEVQGAFTNLVRSTGSVDKSQKLLGVTTDLARAKNISLAKASEIVGKVNNGNTGVLGRYGIKLKDGASATEALGVMQQKFGGQAKAYGESTAGAQDRFKIAVENLQESVGKVLLPRLAQLANAFAGLVGWFEKNKAAAYAVGIGLGAIGGAIAALKIAGFVQNIAGLVKVVRGWAIANTVLNSTFLANPIVLVIAAVAALAAGLYFAYKKSETFRNIVNGAFNAVKSVASVVFSALKTAIQYGLLGPATAGIAIWNAAKGSLGTIWNAIKGAASAVWNAIKSAITAPINAAKTAVTTVANGIGSALGTAWSAIKSATKAAWDFIEDKILGPLRSAREAVAGIVNGLKDRIVRGFGIIKDNIVRVGRTILDAITSPFESAWNSISGIISKIKGAISSINPGKLLKKIPGFAAGTSSAPGGLAVVGEQGPELVNLPRGSRVYSNSDSQKMTGGGTTINFNGNIVSNRAAMIAAERLAFRVAYS